MFDGKAFGEAIVTQVRGFVDAALAPVLARLNALEDAPPAQNGKDADPVVIQRMVDDAVAKAVAAMPKAIDGKNGDDGKPGADGVGLADALIDRAGELVLTFSDGRTKNVGLVAGRDGKDGIDGERGPAGFSLDAFEVVQNEDGRTIELKFDGGDMSYTRELELPLVIYRGVFKDGEAYAVGDMVTWGGSVWACTEANSEKPGEGSKGWLLAVKKGRDGRDGKEGPRGHDGKSGRAGRDLTQMGLDGSKW